MADVLEKGGGAAAPAEPPPYEETYEEYLARQYAEGNVYSVPPAPTAQPIAADPRNTGGTQTVGPSAMDAQTWDASSGYLSVEDTRASQYDYGPPPQPQYVATDIPAGSAPPPPPATLPDWASPLRDPKAGEVIKELPLGGFINAMLDTNFSDYAQGTASLPAPADFQAPPPGWVGTRLPQPPGWQPGTVAPFSSAPVFYSNYPANPNALAAAGRFVQQYADGYDPAYRAYRGSFTPEENEALRVINVVRAQNGLPPLYGLPGRPGAE